MPDTDGDRTAVFDPGESFENLRRLLDLVSDHFSFVRPDPPSTLVPIAAHRLPMLDKLEVILTDRDAGECVCIEYAAMKGHGDYALAYPVQETQIPICNLPAEIERLCRESGGGRWFVNLRPDGRPRFYQYSPGDWMDHVRWSHSYLVSKALEDWLRSGIGAHPEPIRSWTNHIVDAHPDPRPPSAEDDDELRHPPARPGYLNSRGGQLILMLV
jgi:hypothetical protein